MSDRAQLYQTAPPPSNRPGSYTCTERGLSENNSRTRPGSLIPPTPPQNLEIISQYRPWAVSERAQSYRTPYHDTHPCSHYEREEGREQGVRQNRAKQGPRTQPDRENTAVSRESREERAPPENNESKYRRIGYLEYPPRSYVNG